MFARECSIRKLSKIAQLERVKGNTAGVKIERGTSQSIRASLLDRKIIIQNDFFSLALKIKYRRHLPTPALFGL